MTPYELAALTAGVFHLLLAIFVFTRDLTAKVNRTYLIWGGALTIWNLATFFKYRYQNSPDVAYHWLQLLHLALVWLPVSILHLTLLVAQNKRKPLVPIVYCITVLLSITIFIPGAYIKSVETSAYGPIVVGGWAFKVYTVLYTCVAAYTITLLSIKQRRLTALHRKRLQALLIGFVTLVLAGANDLMLVLGGSSGKYPFTSIDVIPLGNVVAIFYGVVVAYSVLQYQLLDINLALSRFAAQTVRVIMMTLVGVLLLGTASLFDGKPDVLFPYFAAVVSIFISSIIASFMFPRLFGKGEELLERRLLGDRFEFQDQIQGKIRRIRDCHEPTLLLAELQDLLVRSMGLRSYQIILLDETTRGFNLFDSYPMQTDTRLPWLSLESAVFRFFRSPNVGYLSCRGTSAMPGEREIERQARAELRQFNPEICFSLISGDDVFGLLLLGPKESEEPFTSNDLQLVQDLVLNLRLVLDQIRLKNQIHLAQEQEMLGRMSRGLAHDLNNLLTPVQTSLQLVQAGMTDPGTLDEILPMALRNVDTIRAYVNEALFFSRTHALKLQRKDLNETAKAAVGLVTTEAQKKNIRISIDGAARAEVEIDDVLIQRLLCNLLGNAIDATPSGGLIRVGVIPLPRTERNREWFRLTIADTGSGISSENLKRVFMPYFSTKNTGDKRRGFGLGLAIARKIVHLHGGNMVISSEQAKGTTVQVDLPNHPPAEATKISKKLAVEFAT